MTEAGTEGRVVTAEPKFGPIRADLIEGERHLGIPSVNTQNRPAIIRVLRPDDILIVAPYNAQVADLSAKLPHARVPEHIERGQKYHAGLTADIATRDAHVDEEFTMKVGNRRHVMAS